MLEAIIPLAVASVTGVAAMAAKFNHSIRA